MKKLINIFSAVIALVSMSIACTQEVAPLASEVSVDKTEVTCEAVQGTTTVKVTCDGEWFATADADWLTITPSAGNGPTEVKIAATDNVDEQWKEVQGPRAGVVSFVVASKIVNVTVNQNGEKGLDSKMLYSPITKAEDFQTDASYMIVAKDGDVYQAAAHVAGNYGYPGFLAVEMGELGITQPNPLTGFTFESAINPGEFYIKQNSDNRYWYQSGSYTNFNVTADLSKAEAPIFSVSFNEDGTAVVKNVGKNQTLQANPARTSYGCYSSFQTGCVYPTLYKSAKAPTDETLSAEEAKAGVIETSAVINVKSNKTWKVRNHDEWIKTFTKSGEGDGTIEVTFDKNPDIATERTASFQIIGETMNITVTLTQGTEELSAEDATAESKATSGKITVNASHAWTVECADEWIKSFTKSGEGNGTIDVTFDANPDPTKERTASFTIKGQTKDITVVLTQMKGKVDIKDIVVGEAALVEGQVTALNKRGFIVTDKTGSVMYYNSKYAGSVKIGDNVQVVCTKVTEYGGAIQLDVANTTYSVLSEGTYTYPSPKMLSATDVDAFVAATTSALAEYVSLEGKLTISGNYLNVVIEGTKNQGSIYNITDNLKATLTSGKEYIFKGYLIGRSSGKYANIVLTGADPISTYEKAASVTSGKQYLLVFSDNLALNPLAATKTYGYPSARACTVSAGQIKGALGECEFTFTSVEGGFNLTQSDGRFLYLSKDGAKSFNAATEIPGSPVNCGVWTVSIAGDGIATISNKMDSSWIQYNPKYSSAGSYKTAQTGAVLPVLYEKK